MKKIALICATLATAGLLMAGCAKGDTALREYMYEQLDKVPNNIFSVTAGKLSMYEITAIREYERLEVVIQNTGTWDELRLIDYGVNGNFLSHGRSKGVDEAKYNGYDNGLEGMDERFDEVLRLLKPALEERIKSEVEGVKERTNLKY